MEMDGVEDPPVTSVKPNVALEVLTSANTLLSSTINPAGTGRGLAQCAYRLSCQAMRYVYLRGR